MILKNFKFTFSLFISIFFVVSSSEAQNNRDEQHIKTSIRMIGHKLLLNLGDSVSRVLPVEKEENRYKIQFESKFQFDPTELVSTIDQVIEETKIAKHYLVEVEDCETNKIVHSYEITNSVNLIPCGGRVQPMDCYSIFITLVDSNQQVNASMFIIPTISIFILIGLLAFLWKKQPESEPQQDANIVSIGNYLFDKKNMVLSFEDKKIDLTGKESDLLILLYEAANTPLKREVILKNVWGDEGDYIGRTLDVFISKLRKKLQADDNIKIVNIRGVGYKLVMNNEA